MPMNKSPDFDIEGYIVDPEAWDESLARDLAQQEGLQLNENYWKILKFMRGFWQQNRIAPDVRHVTRYLSEELDLDKKASKRLLFDLFPYGYVKQACRIAGMRRPRVWSTG